MNLIKETMPANISEQVTKLLLEANELFKPYFSNLTGADAGLRTMAEGREGYARLVSHVALANPDALSRTDDPQVLADRLGYDAELEKLRQLILKLHEQVEETQAANGADIMKMVDSYSDLLEVARKRNESLDKAMREVDDWNKRFANRRPDSETPPAS